MPPGFQLSCVEIPDEYEQDFVEYCWHQARLGAGVDGLAAAVVDSGLDPETARAAAHEVIYRRYRRLYDHWPVTSPLSEAFAELEDRVVTLECVGWSLPELQENAARLMDERNLDTWVGFTAQDAEIFLDAQRGFLAFGCRPDTAGEVVDMTVRQLIVPSLARHGITATWNGDHGTRIQISDVVWRYLPPGTSEAAAAHHQALREAGLTLEEARQELVHARQPNVENLVFHPCDQWRRLVFAVDENQSRTVILEEADGGSYDMHYDCILSLEVLDPHVLRIDLDPETADDLARHARTLIGFDEPRAQEAYELLLGMLVRTGEFTPEGVRVPQNG